MTSLNKIVLIGKIINTPVVRETTNGNPQAKFTLEVSRPPRADGLEPQKDIIPIIVWGQLAEQTSKYNIGSSVLVEGRILTKTIDDPSGKRKWLTDVEARHMQEIIAGNDSAQSLTNQENSTETSIPNPDNSLEEMPSKETKFDFEEDAKLEEFPVPPTFQEEVEEDIPF